MSRFSIIVPLYNKALYAKKALESIVSQTFTDWELIIVDDGSTDNSAAVCEEFLHSLIPSRVHSFRIIHQNNYGVAAARNRGIIESKGDYLCFLDADDWWDPEFLAELDKLIHEYPDAGLYCTNYIYYKPGKTHVALTIQRGYMNYPDAYLKSDAMPITSISTCLLRKVFDEMGGFPVGIKLGEDFLLWAKIALHYKVAFSEKALAFYNNDVPASLRATRNLHAPQYHMLFHLDEIENIIESKSNHQSELWHALLDKLRVSGLKIYWISDEYHDVAVKELKKVDWSKQPKSAVRFYKTPTWLLRAKQSFMRVGSFLKQKLIKASYSKANILFFLFTLAIFVKCVLFNWLCFSTQEENYLLTLLMSLPQKVVPALCIASFVFITKRQIWTVVVNLLIDIWLIANLFYFKANGYFLSYEVMTMVDNMDGFWDSLLNYVGWDIVFFPIITIIYALIISYKNPSKRKYWHTLIVVLLAFSINIVDQALHKLNQVKKGRQPSVQLRECLPFSHVFTYADAEWIDYNVWSAQYVKKFSIVSYLPACVMYRCLAPLQRIETIDIDESRLKPFFSPVHTQGCTPKTNVVFLMVESLESWPLDPITGIEFMPNVNAIAHSNHSLCCRNMKPQVKHGNSADGQLIDITGLLPITDGVVCNSFYNNTYPSWAQCYSHSAIINPWHGVWKQDKMTYAYHFNALIEPKPKDKWSDADIADRVIQYMDTAIQPFALLGITLSSHVPFSYGSESPKYKVDGMPAQLNAYLNCLLYADSCIGAIYRHILQSEELAATTTLVISGDHTIFRTYDKEIDAYAKEINLDMRTTKTCTPLIIYSPFISENIQISDTCYQMDIYPTIMHLIGCENYYWKGFGVNLTDSSAIHNRSISEKEVYELSNMLIRSNWFSDFNSADKVNYIAHAGGSIDGYKYTNSLEAVEHALACGIKYIEMDLCMTTDSTIVAAHDWGHFHEITGHAGDTIPISLEAFSSRRIYDKYTPVTYIMIDSLMGRWPDMYLVTDKISSPRLLSKFFYKDRIIVEAYSYEDYYQLDTMGFHKVFYSRNPRTWYRESLNKGLEWLHYKPISSIPTRYVFNPRKKAGDYKHLYGDEYSIFSLKNKMEADSLCLIDRRIKYIYIDDVE